MPAPQLDPETLERLNSLVGGLPGEREAIAAQLARMDTAAADPGLCGRVRRAVQQSKLSFDAIASSAGLQRMELQQFLEDRLDLESSRFAKLAETLGLTLVYDPLAVPVGTR
jgi:hypothetical protein